MDLKSMKRKDLQELCKRHEIPANSTNSAMIESLESLFQRQKVVKRKGCLKGSGGSDSEGLGIGGSKKVTFVLEEEDEEVEDLGFGGKRGGTNSAKRVPGAPARSTRSRGLAESVLWSPVIEKKVKKRARIGGENSIEGENLDNVKPQVRSLRSRVVMVGGSEGPPEEFERVAKIEGRGKRSRDSNVEEVGQKKLKKQSTDGEVVTEIIRRSTRSSSDGEVAQKEKPPEQRRPSETVIEPPRRATRRSSNLVEEPTHEPSKTAKSRVSEVVTEPLRRLTRSSANLMEDEVIVPVAENFAVVGEGVRKGKSRKQTKEHVPEQGKSAVFVSDREVVFAPTKRSTRTSSNLLGDESSLLEAGKPQKQAKKHVVSVSDSEAVTRSVKRSTRSSSNLKDEGFVVAVVKAQRQAKKHVSGRGGSTVSLSDSKAVVSPMRRSTHSSSKLLEGESSLSAVRKMNDDSGAAMRQKRGKQVKKGSASKASLLEGGTSSRKHGNPEVDSAIMKKGKSSKQAINRAASTAIVPHGEALGRATRRSARSFSLHNLADNRSSRVKLRKSVGDNKVVSKKKRVERHNVRKVVAQPTRRSTRSSPMHGLLDDVGETFPKGKSRKQAGSRFVRKGTLRSSLPISKGARVFGGEKSQKAAQHGEVLRRPRRNASPSNESKQEVSLLMGGTSEDEAKKLKRKKTQKQHRKQYLKEESEASVVDSKIGVDSESKAVGRDCSPYPAMGLFEDNSEEANLKVKISGKQSSRIKQPTQMQEKKGNVEMACNENFERVDLNIAGGDKAEDSELHEGVNISEKVTSLSSGHELPGGSSVALEIVGARNELKNTVDKVVSKIEHSAAPAKSREIGESTLLEDADSMKQSTQVQECNDDRNMISGVNYETVDRNITGGNGAEASVSLEVTNIFEHVLSSDPCSAAPTVDFSIATYGAEIDVTDVNEGNVFELQRSPQPSELTEILGSSETKQPNKKLEENDVLVTSSGNLDLKDHNVMGSDQAGLAETAMNIVEIEVVELNEKKISEVQQSPACIHLQELENATLVEGAHEASRRDPRMDSLSIDFPVCSDKITEFSILIEDSNTGEVSKLPTMSHSKMESFEASPNVEHAKLPKKAPTGINDSQLIETGMEEVRETCQSPTLIIAQNDSEKSVTEFPPSSPSKHPASAQCSGEEVMDHGILQPGLDCASVRVSTESHTSSEEAQLFGADVAEVKFETCPTPTLSFSEDDDVGTDENRNAGEMTEPGLNDVDMQSAAYSAIMEQSEDFTDVFLCEGDNKLIETSNVPGLPLSDDCDPKVVSEFSSSASKIVSHSTGASDVSHRVIISDHGESSDIPLQPAGDKEVINDSNSPACVPEDKQVRTHTSDQQRDPISLCCNAASLDINPDSLSAAYKVLQQLTAEPADDHVDVKLDINVGLADDVVEEMEIITPLKEQSDASVLQAPHEISGEPQTTNFSTHETFETAGCQENMDEKNTKRTTASGKSLKGDASVEDALGLMKDNDISVDKFDKIQEQDDASALTPFRMVAFETAEVSSSIPFETPAYQGEVSNLPTMSHSKMESFEASPNVEHAKLPKKAPTGVNDSQLIETCVEEIRETCQSPTLNVAQNDSEKSETEVPPSSPSKHPASAAQCSGEEVMDHGILQPGLDCASVRVSTESRTSSKEAQLFGAYAAEVKFETSPTPTLSFCEDDDVGTDENRNAGEMTEPGLNDVDMQSAAYSAIMEQSEDFTDVFLCEGDNKLIETSNAPGLPLSDDCDPKVVSEFSSSASKIVSHSTGASDVSHRVIISDHGEASDIPLQPAGDKEVINDSNSPACISEDKQVRTHTSDQERNPLSLYCNAASLDINPDSLSAAYKVLQQLTAEPADDHVDVNLDINVGLADDIVEEMESITPLKEQSDAPVLQAPHEISGEPQTMDFSTHEPFETAGCQGILDDGKALDGGEEVDYSDNCKDVDQGETAVCSTSVATCSALEDAEFNLHHKVNISVMAQDDRVTGILDDEKVPSSCGQSLANLQEQREDIEESSAKEVIKASPEQISVDIKEVSAIDGEKASPPSEPSIFGPKEESSMEILEVSASVANDKLDKTAHVKENTTVLVVQSNYSTHEDASSARDGCFGGEFNRLQQDPLVSRSLQPDAEETYVASSRPLMYLEEFFPMDTDVANIVNDSGQVGQWGERIEDLDFSKDENYLEVNSMKEPGERDKMEEMCFPGRSGAESEETFFLGSGDFTDHEKISASFPIQEEKNLGQGASALKKDEG